MRFWHSCGFFLIANVSAPALAQSGAPLQSARPLVEDAVDEEGSGDIVVTAQKRNETVNTIPVAITALSADDLRAAGAGSLRDFISVVPNLQIHTAASAGYFGLAIRGISTQSYSNAGNPSISTYIDGVYVDLAVGFASGLYDLQRIEVLRGPQGTLYGRSATGGNVNVVTADPKPEFAASADASYGNYNDVQLHGMVNLPVSDTLAVRAAFATRRSDGYYDTAGTTRRRYGAMDDFDGRFTALWSPTDNFRWRVSLNNYRTTGTPGARLIASGDDGKPLNGYPVYNQPSYPDPEPHNYLNSYALRSRMELDIAAPLTLSYVAGYQHIKAHYTYVTAEPGPPSYSAFREYSSYSSSAQFHEVNLSYSSDRFKNVLGASFFNEHIPIDGADAVRGGFNQAFYRFPNNGSRKKSYGFFDQATFSITDKVNLTGGIRYNHDEQSQGAFTQFVCQASNFPGLLIAQIPALTGCTTVSSPYGKGSFSNVSWKAGIDYTMASGTMLYASVTESYKPGGVQPTVPAPLSKTFDSEHVRSYEAGIKAQLADRRINMRLAAFYVDYTDLQAFQNVSLPTTQVLLTLNAGRARNYGIEFEGDWNITPVDHFKAFATYLNATYTKFDGAIDIRTNAIIGSLAGHHLPFAPEWTLRGQYSHDFILADGAKIVPMAAVYWQTENYSQSYNIPVFRIRPYTKTTMSLTYTDPSKRWNLSAYVDNLENNAIRSGDFASQNIVYSEYGSPRTFGARLSFQY
jgi:iron complex outermembrane receptor protein